LKAFAAEDLLRELAPQVLGALVRRYGHFSLAEDATQEALIAAALQWPTEGTPGNPKAWLITVASRKLTDLLRAEQARQRREDTVSQWAVPTIEPAAKTDDTLILLFMCCHESLSPASQIALTLRAVGGLSATEVARAFLVPEATMTRRITRAKQAIKDSGIPFAAPTGASRQARLGAVLHVLYLIYNQGYIGAAEFSLEAIRLTRLVHRLLPGDAEVTGLLALMLLTEARRPARLSADGALIPMASQDRSLWNTSFITEGVALITAVLGRDPAGPYQLQAAIAAIHDEAESAASTDWPQIVALYELLMQLSDNPVVALNHVVAVSMASGPSAGLTLLDALSTDPRLTPDHRLLAVRAHLLDMSGDKPAAHAAYLAAAAKTTSLAQQRYLHSRAVAIRP
jgi:RNA polymerase sigma factor (sigma-70 family)